MLQWRATGLVFALAFHVLAFSVARAQTVQSKTAAETETICGTVVNSVTHEPVGRALVFSPGNEFATLTDSEGHFEFTCNQGNAGISPCQTSLMARKPGFVERYTAQPVTPGKDLVLSLTPEALIVGHVALPSSEPPDRIQVELYQRRVQDGRGRWVLAGSTQTRSTGEFRFADLAAGSYRLLTRELLDRDPLTFNPRGPLFGYPPAYFPSATDFASAETIQLTAGKTFQAEIPLSKHPYYHVRVPVINLPPGTGISVNVSVQGHRGPGFSLGYNMTDQVIDGLLPDGTYTVEGASFGQNAATGLVTITIKGGPVAGPRMVLVQNQSITVNVKEEFTSTEDINSANALAVHNNGRSTKAERYPMDYLNLHLEPTEEFAENPGISRMGPSGPDGRSLTLGNVRPGRYWVNVNSSRGYAASITSGGVDLQHQLLVVPHGGSIDPIEITMRDDWAEIDCSIEGVGAITAEQQNFAAGQQSNTHVYFIPQPDSAPEFRDLWMPPAGETASMQVPPGLYRVLSFNDQEPELEYRDPEAMRAYESKGQMIRLGAGQKEHLRLQVIRASE